MKLVCEYLSTSKRTNEVSFFRYQVGFRERELYAIHEMLLKYIHRAYLRKLNMHNPSHKSCMELLVDLPMMILYNRMNIAINLPTIDDYNQLRNDAINELINELIYQNVEIACMVSQRHVLVAYPEVSFCIANIAYYQ